MASHHAVSRPTYLGLLPVLGSAVCGACRSNGLKVTSRGRNVETMWVTCTIAGRQIL
jgi:hypothetical protein